MNVLANSACSNTGSSIPKNFNTQMCVGSVAGGQGACYGDGGSGVYTFDTNINKYIFIGFPSYLAGCARAGLPS